MKRYCKAIVLCFLLFQTGVLAQGNEKKSFRPKYVAVQFAGNIGLAGVGVGYRLFHDRLLLSTGYGYLPESVNGVEVHTLCIKSSYMLRKRDLSAKTKLILYTGVGMLYGITKNTFIVYPDYYPSGYYKPNALHAAPFSGLHFSFKYLNSPEKSKWLGVFCELGTLDDHLYNIATKKRKYSADIWNLALGLSVEVD